MSTVLERYIAKIHEVTSVSGRYAYRGQERAVWPLHSAATRRLIKKYGEDSLKNSDFPRRYVYYHRDVLIEPARLRGFGIEEGQLLSDLQLLAKLQHFGAATGLLDFTWSPLVALWFACQDPSHDGVVFAVNTTDTTNVRLISSEDTHQSANSIFRRGEDSDDGDKESQLSYWEPMSRGDAMARILGQRSLFIIGRPLIPTDAKIIKQVTVPKGEKDALLKDLERMDINEVSLFQDIYGFTQANGAGSTLAKVEDPEDLLLQGKQQYQRGDFDKAIITYNRAEELAPDSSKLYFLRGQAKLEAKRPEESIHDFDKSIQITPEDADAYNHRGITKSILEDHDGAIKDFSKAIELRPDHEGAYTNRGIAKCRLRRLEEAVSDFGESIKINPHSFTAYYNRSIALSDLGKHTGAIRDLDKAIRLKPDAAGAYFQRGKTRVALGQMVLARKDFGIALKLAQRLGLR